MNKIYYYIFCVSVFLQGCSIDNDVFDTVQTEKANFPIHIEEYGKAVAKELHQTVLKLNKMGVDYMNAEDSKEFKDQFYNDWCKVNPAMSKSGILNSQMQIPSDILAERISCLTKTQLGFIKRITDECDKSFSYEDLCNRLININKDIYSLVPRIEQERLFYITAALYYGLNEIQNLEKQGQMLRTPLNDMQIIRLKTRSESGDGFWGSCRQLVTSAWALAVGDYYFTGELVSAVSFSAATLLFTVVLCTTLTGDTPEYKRVCQEKYLDCMAYNASWARPNSGSVWGESMCESCRRFCVGQGGMWDCPRPK